MFIPRIINMINTFNNTYYVVLFHKLLAIIRTLKFNNVIMKKPKGARSANHPNWRVEVWNSVATGQKSIL